MLYQLTEEIKAISKLVEADTDESHLDHEIGKYLDNLKDALADKTEAYVMLIKDLKAKSAARSMEAARLRESAESIHRTAMGLQERLKQRLIECGETNVQTRLFTISVCENGGKLPLEIHEDDVPHVFKEAKWTPDTGRIRQILEKGETLPFARLGKRKSHLRIK
tara:strand:- start:340 stop:834 length:495 start_codon:yes stop_codon:yes gene_type:complete